MKLDLIEILTLWGLRTLPNVPNWFYILQKCQGLMIICIQHASSYLSRVKVLGWRSSKQNHLRMFSFRCIQSKYLSNFSRGCPPYIGGVSMRETSCEIFCVRGIAMKKRWSLPPGLTKFIWPAILRARYQLWYNGESNLVFVTFGQDPGLGWEEGGGDGRNEVTRDMFRHFRVSKDWGIISTLNCWIYLLLP